MKQKTIDFRELLESVLPLDDLLPADRAEVRRALQGGITRELETAALYALSRLEQRGALRRVPSWKMRPRRCVTSNATRSA